MENASSFPHRSMPPLFRVDAELNVTNFVSSKSYWPLVTARADGASVPSSRRQPMPTTARPLHDIDRGRGGDKVDSIDPAVAPLGTDDEAAGTPPTAAQVKLAYNHEVGHAFMSEKNDDDHGVVIYVTAVILLSSLLLSAIWFIRP
jgi:hypothetical protein